jgi:hypothetical protein
MREARHFLCHLVNFLSPLFDGFFGCKIRNGDESMRCQMRQFMRISRDWQVKLHFKCYPFQNSRVYDEFQSKFGSRETQTSQFFSEF